jgi:hypothetical protein
MTTTLKALVEAKYAEIAETTQYVSLDCKTTIDKATATNVTNANAVISVSLVANGASAGVANRITITKTIAPKAVYTFPEMVGHVLETGDLVSTLAGTTSAIVLRISGRQFT